MARARMLKPAFFTDAELLECDYWVRLLFAGLWTLADRRGIVADSPKQFKISLFPGDDVDIEAGLAELETRGFIVRYVVGDVRCLQICEFARHQNPHPKEPESELPAPEIRTTTPSRENTRQDAARNGKTRRNAASRESQQPNPAIPSIPSSPSIPSLTLATAREISVLRTGDENAPETFDDTPSPTPQESPAETPYALWTTFCEAAGYDQGEATEREKGRSLKTARKLLDEGVTAAEIAALTVYLRSQTWRTSPLSMGTVEAELGKWRMAGRPPREPTRSNGRQPPVESWFALANQLGQEAS